jgi:hypothetical protein
MIFHDLKSTNNKWPQENEEKRVKTTLLMIQN